MITLEKTPTAALTEKQLKKVVTNFDELPADVKSIIKTATAYTITEWGGVISFYKDGTHLASGDLDGGEVYADLYSLYSHVQPFTGSTEKAAGEKYALVWAIYG